MTRLSFIRAFELWLVVLSLFASSGVAAKISAPLCKGAKLKSATVEPMYIGEFQAANMKVADKLCREGETCVITVEDKGPENSRVYLRERAQPLMLRTSTTCRYGAALKDMCMEPCRTITADLDVKQKGNEVFEIGDVIHIPQLKGIHCPDGQVNPDGLFVIGQDYRKPNAGTSKFELFLGSCKQLKGDVCGDQLMAGVVAKLKSEIDYCYVKNVSEDD